MGFDTGNVEPYGCTTRVGSMYQSSAVVTFCVLCFAVLCCQCARDVIPLEINSCLIIFNNYVISWFDICL